MDPHSISQKKERDIDTLDGLHEHAVKVSENIFASARDAGQTTPFRWLCRRGRKHLSVIDTPWENEREKARHIYFMRAYMLISDIDAYTSITEAWIANGQPGDMRQPSERRPDEREDVLFVTTFDKTGDRRITRFGVSRANSRFAKLKVRDDWTMDDAMKFGGRMFNLLEPERNSISEILDVSEEERREAIARHRQRVAVDEALGFVRLLATSMAQDELIRSLMNVTRTMYGDRK